MNNAKDPYGIQPRHVTGSDRPDYSDLTLPDREEAATTAFKSIWIDHGPQEAAMYEVRAYRRQTLKRTPGVALSGRRLSQETQAGKSALTWRLKMMLEQERVAAGLPANPYQIIIITIERRMTLKSFYQEILKEMGDDFHAPDAERDDAPVKKLREDRRSYKLLEQRIAEWVVRLGVEMIVADEAQRLDRVSEDASDVTDRIQTFLDRGVVPLLLIGNGKSKAFFEKNKDLAARLGTPIELKQLDPDACAQDAKDFKAFCRNFDKALVAAKAVAHASNLNDEDILEALLKVSDGHVGRVARLIEEALPLAVRRGASSIERIDLSNATRNYAIGNGWVDLDPFSS